MDFFAATKRILLLEEEVYSHIFREGKVLRFCFVNLLLFGLFYGLFAMLFSGMLSSAEVPLQYLLFFLVAGVGFVFLAHAGLALFLWVFTRAAAGGVQPFFPLYFHVGISMAAAWPLAPVLAGVQAGYGGVALYALLALALLYALASVFVAVKSVTGLSVPRMCGAFAACAAVLVSMVYIYAF